MLLALRHEFLVLRMPGVRPVLALARRAAPVIGFVLLTLGAARPMPTASTSAFAPYASTFAPAALAGLVPYEAQGGAAIGVDEAALYARARTRLRLHLALDQIDGDVAPQKAATHWREPKPAELDALLAEAAARYHLPVTLLRAVAWRESQFHHRARSAVGAIGVMQLMPETARRLGVNPYDLRQNVMGGGAYLASMLEAFDGDVTLALAAYNAGPHAVRRHKGVPPYAETRAYVAAILAQSAPEPAAAF